MLGYVYFFFIQRANVPNLQLQVSCWGEAGTPGPTALVSETFEQIQKLRNFLKTYIYLCVSLLSSFENIDDN